MQSRLISSFSLVDPSSSSSTLKVDLWRWNASSPLESSLAASRAFNVSDLRSPLVQRHVLRLDVLEEKNGVKEAVLILKFQFKPPVCESDPVLSPCSPHSLDSVQKTYIESKPNESTASTVTTYVSSEKLPPPPVDANANDAADEGGHIGIALAALHDLAVKRRRRKEADAKGEKREASPARTTMLIRSVQTVSANETILIPLGQRVTCSMFCHFRFETRSPPSK